MEVKAKPRASSSAALAHADKQIYSLFQKHLPAAPHIFFVPTNNPYLPNFPHENRNIPFEQCEIPKLQYMTLISNGDRGVGASKGASDWEDEVYGKSPSSAAGPSSTSTPNPVRDQKKPSQKISFGDYKNFKQTGVKPSPRPYTPEQKARQDALGHSRNTSAVPAITPMGRVLSSERGDLRPAAKVHVNSVTVEKVPMKDNERSTVPRSTHVDTKDAEKAEKARLLTNGHHPAPPNMAKGSNLDSRVPTKSEHPIKEAMKHPLPPRPHSPSRSNPEQKKRPLESGETHPEKRVKIGHEESRTPSGSQSSHGSQKDAPRKSEATVVEAKPPPSKSQRSSAASPLPKKPTPTTKHVDIKAQTPKSSNSNPDKPLDLPPLLSPLAADLGASPDSHATLQKSEFDKVSSPKTFDTIVVKRSHSKSQVATSSPLRDPPKSSSPPFVLPPLLSPGLPAIVEEELLRLQQKSATLNTVEARHEKARLPDAPGVARKTPRNPKVGHPPKRSHVESSKLATVPEKEVKRSLIVKIPYKKRTAIHIQRILALTQKPRGQMEKLEAGERLARERSTSAAPPKDESESGEDVPLSKSRSTKALATIPTAKKRPNDSADRNEQPPLKRSKVPEIDIAKASTPGTPAFKSPALPNPSTSAQKSLLATPKKGDAMKSVALRRVDSSDSVAGTPQTTSTSTPASAEKHRPNGVEPRPNPELDKQKADDARFYNLGTTLKRKMDSLISLKHRDPSAPPISESERKTGACVGVESLMAYMLAFHARDRIAHLRGVPPDPGAWDGFIKLQIFLSNTTKHFAELNALVEQLGAVAREKFNRVLMEHIVLPGKAEKLSKDLRENSLAKDKAWLVVKRNQHVLSDLGVKTERLDVCSTVQEAVALAGETLGLYSKREEVEWSPDAQFAAALASK